MRVWNGQQGEPRGPPRQMPSMAEAGGGPRGFCRDFSRDLREKLRASGAPRRRVSRHAVLTASATLSQMVDRNQMGGGDDGQCGDATCELAPAMSVVYESSESQIGGGGRQGSAPIALTLGSALGHFRTRIGERPADGEAQNAAHRKAVPGRPRPEPAWLRAPAQRRSSQKPGGRRRRHDAIPRRFVERMQKIRKKEKEIVECQVHTKPASEW